MTDKSKKTIVGLTLPNTTAMSAGSLLQAITEQRPDVLQALHAKQEPPLMAIDFAAELSALVLTRDFLNLALSY